MNLIALDLDGTLEDSRRDMTSAVHRVRKSLKLPARTDDAVLPWVNQGMETLYRNCFDDYLTQGGMVRVQQAYEADYMENVARETRLYPGIPQTLETLRELGCLAVVTNKPERISRRLLEVLGVGGFITAVVGGDTCGEIKPSPALLHAAARLCGFSSTKGRAFMIGDTAADIKMGRAFGATTVWCGWGYADSPGENPDFIARAATELPGLVRSTLDGSRDPARL
jgi:phosphoglycolate phosphatase